MHSINRCSRFLGVVSLSLAIAIFTTSLLSWFPSANQAAQASSVEELRQNWERAWRKLFDTQPSMPPVPPVPPVPPTPSVPPTRFVPPTNAPPKPPEPPEPPTSAGGCCR